MILFPGPSAEPGELHNGIHAVPSESISFFDPLQGHEFTGTVEEVGSMVKNFQKGDQIVSPFTTSW